MDYGLTQNSPGYKEEKPAKGYTTRTKKADNVDDSELNTMILFWTTLLVCLLIALVMFYIYIYISGRGYNTKLVQNWWNMHKNLLYAGFIYADDGPKAGVSNQNLYTLCCEGRGHNINLLVEIELVPRDDFLWPLMNYFNPQRDMVHLRFTVPRNALESFVFAVGKRNMLDRLIRKYMDLDKHTEFVKRYDVPTGYTVLSEIPEATAAVLMDMGVSAALKTYKDIIEYIYVSDQFSNATDILGEPVGRNQGVIIMGYKMPSYNTCRCADIMQRLYVFMQRLLYDLVDYDMSVGSQMRAEKKRADAECPCEEQPKCSKRQPRRCSNPPDCC